MLIISKVNLLLKKKSFLNNLGLLFSVREKVLNKTVYFHEFLKILDKIPTREPTPEPAKEQEVTTEPTKPTKAKTKHRTSSVKLRENFLIKIKNEGKNINEQIFREYFNYQFLSFF